MVVFCGGQLVGASPCLGRAVLQVVQVAQVVRYVDGMLAECL